MFISNCTKLEYKQDRIVQSKSDKIEYVTTYDYQSFSRRIHNTGEPYRKYFINDKSDLMMCECGSIAFSLVLGGAHYAVCLHCKEKHYID